MNLDYTDELNELSDFSKLHVLIIDDNPLIHNTLKRSFVELGIHNIKCAQNSAYALRLCEEIHFHIVICAFNVTSDKDGFHLLEELKFKGFVSKCTVLIFLSSETSETLVNCIVELQPDDFWVKPLQPLAVQERLKYILQVKKKLYNIYFAIDTHEYSTAIYYADRHLKDPNLKKYHLNILRMRGESLIDLMEFEDAEMFYRSLLNKIKISWIYLGFVKSLLKQHKISEIEDLLETLISQPDTRFATYDLLAQYHIENEEYDLAYDEIKKATELAPRNIERNKKSWDLARLTHDYEGQFNATKNMAKYAKNSIHDNPELQLNVIRAGVDYASTVTDEKTFSILNQTDTFMYTLEHDYDDITMYKEAIIVIKARLHALKDEKSMAQRLIDNNISLKPSPSIEENLDKVKIFHELGQREESVILLNSIKNQVMGDCFASQVVNKYVEQESEERTEIHFTPKQLNTMAVEFYKKNKMRPALNSLSQALKIAPHNHSIAISLLKVLLTMKRDGQLMADNFEIADSVIIMMEKQKLEVNEEKMFKVLKDKWQDGIDEIRPKPFEAVDKVKINDGL
ncbi:response regulator [Pseudoalteromonas sp. C2R02]|uniref:response regulator n=1 Tax=Pseudoalteromonas sp. C2R02 TaxID=2841565 RepID=UPI001C088390|nr:response regulator [Pseudoalteromonas sp. C2R02]MBU2968370.1 response regulator [Pseudoalteromonas sp. C2R02]